MVEEADYTNWRVMVDDTGKVLRDEEQGGYCVWNIEDQSVVILPPDDDSTNLIAHLLLRPEEDSTQSVLKIAVQSESEDETPTTPKKETKDKSTNYWSTETPNVEGSRNCIELLIMVVGTYLIQKMLKDNKTDKKRVWEIVANKMNDCGYRVPGKTLAEQGVEVQEKWKYIEMTYLKFQNNEGEKQDRPSYFDMLDKVLGNKQDDSKSSDSDSQDRSIKTLPDVYEDSVDIEDSEKSNYTMCPSLLFQIMEDLSDYENNCPPQKKPTKDDIINYWSTETPNVEGCKNCTELMITFVGEDLIQELINEKSLALKKVWQYIAKLMADHGYPVPGQKFEEQGEKVYQKWKNMGRMYAKFKELSSLTQPAYRDPPCYFDVLDKVVQKLQQADNTKLLLNSFSEVSHEIDNQQNNSAEDDTSGVDSGYGKPRKEDIINYWATKTPDVEGCKDCTELLIMFIGEESIQEMFNDKRSSQKKVWQFLAKIMADHGYRVPGQTVEEQGEKVYQKWKNMGRMYVKYKDHASKAEPAYKDPPSCFAALDKVVQQLQQSQNQKCLLGSFSLANTKKPSSPLPEDGYDIHYSRHIKEEPSDVDMSMYEISPSIYKPTKDEIINYWLTNTPDMEGCRNCTELLIKIAGGEPIQKLLTNKKTSKKKVWQIVAKQLSDLGYEVPGPTIEEQGEKVYQKWKNMGNSYTKFKAHLLQTGQAHKDPPLFFEALDKVLGKNDAFRPKLLLDSFSNNSQIQKKSTVPEVEEIPVTPFKLQLPKQQPEPTVEQFINRQTNQPLMKDEPTSYWYTDTPNIEGCRNCAELLIWIVGEESVQKMLRDKVIPKKKVWQKVAKIMNDYGYKVPGMLLGLQGERVHQKWRNMVKVYVKYKEYIRETGDVHKDPPAYFDLMDMVMRMKYVHTQVPDSSFSEGAAKIENSQQPYPVSKQKRTNPANFWLVETPNVQGCRNRTELLISIVGQKSVQNMLDNKTITQRKVWQMVAKKMLLYGHKAPGRTLIDQGNRVRDKWRSLEKVYMKYKRHSKHTEQAQKFFPPYFFAMDRMLGKGYVCPLPRKSRNFKIKKEKQISVNDSDMQCSESEDTTTADTSSIYKCSRKNTQYNSYWLTETPNLEGIRNVTELLIMTVGDAMIHKMLHNRRNAKRKVWQYVVHKIEEYGYSIPGNTVAEKGEKLRQKWGNMEKMYMKYRHYEDNTGQARKFFPYYYDAMHKVLGKKQVIRPKIIRPPHSPLTDSLELEQNSDSENTNSSTAVINKSNSIDTDTIQGVDTPNYQYSFDELHSYWLTETPNIEGVQNRSELLIRIVGGKSIQTMLKNKKSAKKKVWQLVALKMAKLGHIVPGMTVAEQGARVRQKWKNMQKVYSKHKEQITELGESWKDPPYYYTTMDEVLREADVDHPKLLLGSVHSLKSSQRASIWGHSDDSPRPSTSSDVSMQVKQDPLENGILITNEIESGEDEEIRSEVFPTPKSTMCFKFKENNSLLTKMQEEYYIKELKNMIIEECTKEREAQQRSHDEITKLLKRQNQQRDNMISIIRQLLEKSSDIRKEN